MRYADAIDRPASGPPRPERRLGRRVLYSQSPHRCPVPDRPHLARPGQSGVGMSSQVLVGIDVANAQLHMALRPTGERGAVTNADRGIAALVTRLQEMAPPLMVLEATGSDQPGVVTALAAAGLPVVGVHPRHARDGAKATGPLAKTAVLDARALAPFAEAVRPAPRPRPDAPTEALRARRARRRQLIARRTAEQNRLGTAPRRLQAAIEAPLTGLNEHLGALDDDLDTTLRARPLWREHEALLRRVPGMGPVCTRTGRLDLPELGTWRRQRIAALVGGAPFKRDRGTLRGSRTVWGGRPHVRATLSMSPLVAVRYHPVRKGFDERLRAAGKAAKVALTACMRQLVTLLNAMVKHQTPWQPREVLSAEHTRPKDPRDNQDSCSADPPSRTIPGGGHT